MGEPCWSPRPGWRARLEDWESDSADSQTGAAAPDGGLSVTLRAAVAVKGRSQTSSIFSFYGARYGIYFHECFQSFRKVGLFVGTEAGVEAPGGRLRAAWPWILLRFKSPGGNRGEQAETHYGRNEHLWFTWSLRGRT